MSQVTAEVAQPCLFRDLEMFASSGAGDFDIIAILLYLQFCFCKHFSCYLAGMQAFWYLRLAQTGPFQLAKWWLPDVCLALS
jgi:hypothetical protein